MLQQHIAPLCLRCALLLFFFYIETLYCLSIQRPILFVIAEPKRKYVIFVVYLMFNIYKLPCHFYVVFYYKL